MAKFGIDKGHNCPYDTGAVGVRKEDNLTLALGDKVIEYLRLQGHEVTDCTPVTASSLTESLYLRSTVANRDNVDFFLSIHFNAGGGKGTEAYAMSDAGRAFAARLVEEVVSLGFIDRGVKLGSGLYVIRNTNAPAVLLEVAFVDSQEDMDKVDTVGIDAIAKRIVKALTGQEVEEPKPDYHGLMARVHIQNKGWTEFIPCVEGNVLGTTGEGLRLESIEFKIV
jgi:N-acetylmuramoyl-L-alanine amidase